MGLFDKDPKYQNLKKIRQSGFKGPVDHKGDAVMTNRSKSGEKKDAERARKLGKGKK